MLSFKQFNEERKVDPEKLAVRIAKKYGKKERYGKWLTAEKGKHVPLKSYRSKEAESVFNKFDRVARKHPDYGKKHGAVDHLFSHKKMEIKHKDHLEVYGKDNHLRLTGIHETSSIDKFTFKDGDRGASIRIPYNTIDECKGYFEDRRPGSNADPYLVTSKIFETCCL